MWRLASASVQRLIPLRSEFFFIFFFVFVALNGPDLFDKLKRG